MEVLQIWYCTSCKQTGAVPGRPEFKDSESVLQNALMRDHGRNAMTSFEAFQREEDGWKNVPICNAKRVDSVPEWMLFGILNILKERLEFLLYDVDDEEDV